MYKLHYYQRKRRDGKNFSLEQIFEDLRNRFKGSYNVQKIEAPFVSSGLFKRLYNVIYAIFHQGDVNHITGDINYMNLFLSKKRNILTILDCGILHRTKGLRRVFLKLIWFQLPVWRSRYVTVISQATKDDLLSNINCNSEKVKVIYVPISQDFSFVSKEFNGASPRILQIGAAPNKNLSRLIEAVTDTPCVLVIIGEIDHTNTTLLVDNNIDFENYIGIPFDKVIEEYQKSDLLFFASTFEGFGMPILEAQATGRAVITSNILSMPEVGGEGAHYVNPYDVGEIKAGIVRLISDRRYREDLIKKGLKNVERFDPETIANQYNELYKEIILDIKVLA